MTIWQASPFLGSVLIWTVAHYEWVDFDYLHYNYYEHNCHYPP
jgi:hypothetical protein